jgi:membrane protein DedA with SNARE-associated domain
MPDLTPLISHWGYLAIFLFVLLGNLGLPVPEESILVLAAAILLTAGLLGWRMLRAARAGRGG